MLSLIFVTLLAAESLSLFVPLEYSNEWSLFKSRFEKKYLDDVDELSRLEAYTQNRRRVLNHNKLYDLGLVSFKQSINQFSDMAHKDFMKKMTGYIPSVTSDALLYQQGRSLHLQAAKSKDWRDNGYVTSVKNQGECGCCWAFSATGVLEGQYFNKTGKLVPLSEQNLLDCTAKNSCNGGTMNEAFNYVISNGISSETYYPYKGEKLSCKQNSNKNILKAKKFYKLPSGDEKTLMDVSYTFGPISVAIDASPDSFMSYRGGIYDDSQCSSTNLNHAVLLVGYGSESGRDYWLVKNSWGTSWGENGYVRIARNKRNMCGIASDATYAVL